MDSVDEASFQDAIQRLFPDAEEVILSVQSGSIIVFVEVILPSASAAVSAANAVETMNTESLSSALGYTIESLATPTMYALSPPAPPMSPRADDAIRGSSGSELAAQSGATLSVAITIVLVFWPVQDFGGCIVAVNDKSS